MDTEPIINKASFIVQEMSITPEGASRDNDVLPDNIACYYICNMHKMASYLTCPGTMCQGEWCCFEIWRVVMSCCFYPF
jgi:hypothetical protein